MALATLAHWLEHWAEKERHHFLVQRPAQIELGAVAPLFMTAKGLSSWLGQDAAVDGDAVRVDLGSLGQLDGRVLTRTAREALLSWPARRAVLGLKAFTHPTGDRVLAVDVSTWGDAAPRAELEAYLGEALDRLVRRLAATA